MRKNYTDGQPMTRSDRRWYRAATLVLVIGVLAILALVGLVISYGGWLIIVIIFAMAFQPIMKSLE